MRKPNEMSVMPTASKKRCGTCIDRKISCDRRLPQCSSCVRSNRVCQGYGLRLSWPRENDRKRLLIGQHPDRSHDYNSARRSKNLHVVNVTSWDIQMYRFLTLKRRNISPPAVRSQLPSSLTHLAAGEKDLFQYFQRNVSSELSTFTNQLLGETLTRVALSSDSRAGVAVQRAVLAFSALYRYGPGVQAQELKLSALRALVASAAEGIAAEDAVQHVAAGMALCLYETQHCSESSSQWLWYLRGARSVINTISVERFCKVRDASVLLEWVYYHEVLARFTLRHWRRSDVQRGVNNHFYGMQPYLPGTPLRLQDDVSVVHIQEPLPNKELFGPLRALYEVAAVVLPAADPFTQTIQYKARIEELKEGVEGIKIPSITDPSLSGLERCAAAKAEVYRLSTLIYLSHATGDDLIPPPEMALLVDRAFDIFSMTHICERPFPLLILGCDAHTDEQRLLILDLISATEKSRPLRDLECLRRFLHAVWTQDDLCAEAGVKVNYMEKLSAVISSNDIMPPFA